MTHHRNNNPVTGRRVQFGINAEFIGRMLNQNSRQATNSALCLLVLACWAAAAPTETNHQAFLTSTEWASSHYHYSYWIDPDSFPGKVSWNEGKEPFPLALDAEVRRTSEWLVQNKQITNILELETIRISRTLCQRRLGTSDREGLAPVYGWTVNLGFYEVHEYEVWRGEMPETHQVVMLLDGTYATERKELKSQRERKTSSLRNSFSSTGTIAQSDSQTHPPREKSKKESPFELVRRPDFRVPEVQWDTANPLPIDLNDLVGKASDVLVQLSGMPETFVLQDIEFWRFDPDGAVPNVAGRLRNHHWHWIIRCDYFKTGWPNPKYEAYLLLDGRILTVSTPQKTSDSLR